MSCENFLVENENRTSWFFCPQHVIMITLLVLYLPQSWFFVQGCSLYAHWFSWLKLFLIMPVYVPFFLCLDYSGNSFMLSVISLFYTAVFLLFIYFFPLLKAWQKKLIILSILVFIVLATVSLLVSFPKWFLMCSPLFAGLSNILAFVLWLYWLSKKSRIGFVVGLIAVGALSILGAMVACGCFGR